jgi:hypothetical protein
VAGAGNVLITLRGAPVLDPTDEGELEIEQSATTPALYSTVVNASANWAILKKQQSDFYSVLPVTKHPAILEGILPFKRQSSKSRLRLFLKKFSPSSYTDS